MYQQFIHWLMEHQLKCPFKIIIQIDCPGCGAQRSIIALLQGNFKESFILYPAIFPMLLFLFYSLFSKNFKFNMPKKLNVYSYWCIGLFIAVSYVFKFLF